LLAQSDVLTNLLAQCQAANVSNGQSIQIQQAATANQLKILTAANLQRCTTPGLTAKPGQAAPAQPGVSLRCACTINAKHAGKMLASRSRILSGD
jgi:hypothetical protein